MEETKKLRNFFDGKTILVTGGTGSFGHYIVNELLKFNPKKIIVFSRDEDKQYKMEMEYKSGRYGFALGDVFKLDEEDQFKIRNTWKEDKLNFALGDVRDFERVIEITKKVDIIYHAAALKQVPFCEFHPFEAFKTNVIGAHNVKIAAINNNVEKVISISTDKAVKPVNAMGMSKALQEKIMLSEEEMEYDTKFACVRYGNVIGSRGSVIPLFKDKIEHNEPLHITHRDMTRFLLTLTQAIELVFDATLETKHSEIFVRKAPACKVIDLAKVMAESLTGKKDYPIVEIGIRPGEKINEVLVSEEEMHRTKETEKLFIVYPHNFYFTKKLNGQLDVFETSKITVIREYTSATTHQLNQNEILELLQKTGWIPDKTKKV
jgi:FlaA1/EpsC-like NDP-sugar epimerase